MSIHVETNIDRCRALWDRFSPRESLYDLWEFRYPFWDAFQFEPRFVVLEREGKEAGVLPLWYHPGERLHLWFGDTGDDFHWQEGTAFWAESAEDVQSLLAGCPRPALLHSISQECYDRWHHLCHFEEGSPKSILSLKGMHSVDDYLLSLPKKLRSNLRQDWDAIDAQMPVIVRDDRSCLQALVEMNVARFKDSPLRDQRMVRAFETLVQPEGGCPYEVTIIAVRFEDDIAGVDLLFLYNGVAYPLLCGSNAEWFPGIGHYMTLLDIEEALRRSLSRVDFAEYDVGEHDKSRLFPTVRQYKLALPTQS